MIIFSFLDDSLENLPLVLEHFVFFIFVVIVFFVINVFLDVIIGCLVLIWKPLSGYLILLNVSIVSVDILHA